MTKMINAGVSRINVGASRMGFGPSGMGHGPSGMGCGSSMKFSLFSGSQISDSSFLNDEKMKAILDKKVQLIETGFEVKLKNYKPLLLEHAC